MRRYFFFVLFFPAAFMNLLLIEAQPEDLTHYLLAGYVIVAFPAAAIALIDEFFSGATDAARTVRCGLAGLILSPLAMSLFFGTEPWRMALTAACGGLAAFLCAVAFVQLDRPRRVTASAAA
jgi:hypothetical protein